MSQRPDQAGTRDPQALGDWWPWLLVGVAVIFGPRLAAWHPPSELARWFRPAVYAAVAALVCWVWWRMRTRQKTRVVTRLAGGLAPLMGRGFTADQVRVRRWWWNTPRSVVIDYPDEVDDRDPQWRDQVISLLKHRMSAEKVRTTWDENRGILKVVRLRPDPVVEPDEIDVERNRISTRIVTVLAPLFGVDIDVKVNAWRTPGTSETGARINLTKDAVDQVEEPATDPAEVIVEYKTMTRDTSELWQKRVETVLGLKLGGRWRSAFDLVHDRATFEPRPTMPETVPHPGVAAFNPQLLRPLKPFLPYGIDEDGNPVGWTLGAPTMPHTLCIGPTGGGKTTFLRSLIVGATCQGVPVYGCDPKRIELTPYRGYPGVRAVASSPEDMAALIEAIHAEMMRRYEVIERTGRENFRRIVFIIDEFLILRSALNRLWATSKPKNARGTVHPTLGLITEMLVLARSAGIHLVIGVQRPDASIFGDEGARDNLRHRVSLTRLSREGSTMLWQSPYVGVDLPLLAGRAMASPDGRAPVEVQTYWLSDPRRAYGEDREIVDELHDLAVEAMHEIRDGVDLAGLSDHATAYLVASEPTVITDQADLPVAVTGPLIEKTATTGQPISSSGGSGGEDYDLQLVTAETLMIDDQVLTDSGEIGTIRSAEAADYDDDVIELDITAPSGSTILALDRTATIHRILDLTDPVQASDPHEQEHDDDYEMDFS